MALNISGDFLGPSYREPEYKRETEEERIRREAEEEFEREAKEEKEMLEKGEINEHLIMRRIEHYIVQTNVCYYQLCDFAYYYRPTWSVIIRKNSDHIFRLIDSYTKYRQHCHNVFGDPGTDNRRNVTYDTADQSRYYMFESGPFVG